MTGEKLKRILVQYWESLDGRFARRLGVRMYSHETSAINSYDQERHVAWMCEQAQDFVDQGRIEKAMRWLGFVQGWMWAVGYKTLDNLKHDSMPDDEVSP